MKRTNGTWRFVPSPRDKQIGRVVDANGNVIVDSESQYIPEAYMRLIAAAPAILGVLRRLQPVIDCSGVISGCLGELDFRRALAILARIDGWPIDCYQKEGEGDILTRGGRGRHTTRKG